VLEVDEFAWGLLPGAAAPRDGPCGTLAAGWNFITYGSRVGEAFVREVSRCGGGLAGKSPIYASSRVSRRTSCALRAMSRGSVCVESEREVSGHGSCLVTVSPLPSGNCFPTYCLSILKADTNIHLFRSSEFHLRSALTDGGTCLAQCQFARLHSSMRRVYNGIRSADQRCHPGVRWDVSGQGGRRWSSATVHPGHLG